METTYTWEPVVDGSTSMTLRNRGEPTGFSKIAPPGQKVKGRVAVYKSR